MDHLLFQKIRLLGLFLLLKIGSYAQQPAFFIMAEDQFRGVQIYDIIQDHHLNYWFSTNEGIYLYDYNSFSKVDCQAAKSNSVFNFVANSKGQIFCNNLNSQVFLLENNSCQLYYELTDDEYSSDIQLTISDKDELVINGSKIIIIDADKNIKRKTVTNLGSETIYRTKNGTLFIGLNRTDSVLIYQEGNFSYIHLKSDDHSKLNLESLFFFEDEDSIYAIDKKNEQLFSYRSATNELHRIKHNALFKRGQSIRIYKVGKKTWFAGTLPGILPFKSHFGPGEFQVFYPEYFISDVYTDREGNLLLGTFDQGIIVIPDSKIPDVINKFSNDPIHALIIKNSLLFLGSSKGNIYQYQSNKLQSLNCTGNRPITAIYSCPDCPYLIFDNGQVMLYNLTHKSFTKLHYGSLKDVAFESESSFYIGTNYGVDKIELSSNTNFYITKIPELNYRVYALAYHPIKQSLYISTARGLYEYDSLKQLTKITYQSEEVFAQDLSFANEQLFLSSAKHGFLKLSLNNKIEEIILLNNRNKEYPTQFIIKNDSLFVKSTNGLLLFHLNGNLLQNISSNFGIVSKRILNFCLDRNNLWISHSGGVQNIDLITSSNASEFPELILKNCLVNNKEIDLNHYSHFTSDEHKVQFNFSVPTLRNRESYFYYYRLKGYETTWNSKSIANNSIVYNALAPGEYQLEIRLQRETQFSKTRSFSFSIQQPYYLRWWFFLVSALLFIIIVILVYAWQMKRLRKKSQQINELNASKLAAIQSQMNPHFIFNSLNSIQDLVLQGDVENSYTYITTFSNLVRKTLNHSEKEFIDFEEEIQLLEIYLSLEKLRFKSNLTYSITTNGIEGIKIPPLLIQPFIENALVHGLLHKAGNRNLKLNFELREHLICIIEDNGIGREKAKAIRLRQRAEHISFSSKAIEKRLAILSSIFKSDYGYFYEDLKEKGEAVGTRVTLHIPTLHDY